VGVRREIREIEVSRQPRAVLFRVFIRGESVGVETGLSGRRVVSATNIIRRGKEMMLSGFVQGGERSTARIVILKAGKDGWQLDF